jgi:hypothetical protein
MYNNDNLSITFYPVYRQNELKRNCPTWNNNNPRIMFVPNPPSCANGNALPKIEYNNNNTFLWQACYDAWYTTGENKNYVTKQYIVT